MRFTNTFLTFIWWNIFISQFEIDKVSVSAAMDEVEAMKFLVHYGYLHMSFEGIRSGKRASKEDMSKALRDFQERYNLNVTGILDKNTIDFMGKPRCGNPDILTEYNSDFWRLNQGKDLDKDAK